MVGGQEEQELAVVIAGKVVLLGRLLGMRGVLIGLAGRGGGGGQRRMDLELGVNEEREEEI